MWSLIRGLLEAPLLRRVWFQCLAFALFSLAFIQASIGYDRYQTYRAAVEVCVTDSLQQVNASVASSLKNGDFELITVRLNSIEFSCAFPPLFYERVPQRYSTHEQANFFWVVEKESTEDLRIGKDLLKGPISTVVYPLSIWDKGDDGDYWVGTLTLQLFFGDFVGNIIEERLLICFEHMVLTLLLLTATFLLLYVRLIKPNQDFIFLLSRSGLNSSTLRSMIAKRRDEVSVMWRSFLRIMEDNEVERFEFEAQIKDLESHIRKVERGQVGQSLSTEQASLHIKDALSRPMYTEAKKASAGNQIAQNNADFFNAVMSVSANLHERAKMESGEIALAEIPFNFHVLVAQILAEFKPRFSRRGIGLELSIQDDLPDRVIGDPEKIKRIVRNAFKRVLLQPNIERISFSAGAIQEQHESTSFTLELVGVPDRYAETSSPLHQPVDRKKLNEGPTPILEMLCHIMGARWAFTSGLDGELKQSLTVSLHTVSSVSSVSDTSQTNTCLPELTAFIYDLSPASSNTVFDDVRAKLKHVEYFTRADRMLYEISRRNGAQLDLVIVSDLYDNTSSKDFLPELRRRIPLNCKVLVVSYTPHIGDAQRYSELGVEAFLSRDQFILQGERAIEHMFEVDDTAIGFHRHLLTRYTLIDALGTNQELGLPLDLCPEATNSLLLISQELVCVEYVRLYCVRSGVRLVHYDSSFDAIDAFREESFELVVIDEDFEDIDALTLLEMLRSIEAKLAVPKPVHMVALCGMIDDDIVDVFTRAGADSVLNKSIIDGSLSMLMSAQLGTLNN